MTLECLFLRHTAHRFPYVSQMQFLETAKRCRWMGHSREYASCQFAKEDEIGIESCLAIDGNMGARSVSIIAEHVPGTRSAHLPNCSRAVFCTLSPCFGCLDVLAQDPVHGGLVACTATDAHDATLHLLRSFWNDWSTNLSKEALQ